MLTWILAATLLQVGPPLPPRDAPPPTTGTGAIAGLVVAADTGAPLRQATVTLMGGEFRERRPIVVRADAAGRYRFTNLPPGTYFVNATAGPHNALYLPGAYGKREPPQGDPIQLADGQVLERIDVRLPRGGVISGRVVDDDGEPVARAMVVPLLVTSGGRPHRSGGDAIQSDEHGRFRVFALAAGTYLLRAEPRDRFMMMPGAEMPAGDETGFVPTYASNTPHEGDGDRFTVRAGEETSGVEIRLVRARTFRISGLILDSRGRPSQSFGMVVAETAAGADPTFRSSPLAADQEGRFTVTNLLPGNYRLIVGHGTGPRRTGEEGASVPVTIGYADVENLVITLTRGATVKGQVVYAEGPPSRPGGVVVTTRSGERMQFGPTPMAEVDEDLSFTLEGLFTPVLLRPFKTPPGWALKGVFLGNTDVTDTPTLFTEGDSGRLQVVLTSRAATVEGTVTDDRGELPPQAVVVAFSEDPGQWNGRSSRVRIAPIAPTGRYRMTGVLPGRYLLAVVPGTAARDLFDAGPELFEKLAGEATPAVVNEDETRTVDLRSTGR